MFKTTNIIAQLLGDIPTLGLKPGVDLSKTLRKTLQIRAEFGKYGRHRTRRQPQIITK
jgi:hypothetical protein